MILWQIHSDFTAFNYINGVYSLLPQRFTTGQWEQGLSPLDPCN